MEDFIFLYLDYFFQKFAIIFSVLSSICIFDLIGNHILYPRLIPVDALTTSSGGNNDSSRLIVFPRISSIKTRVA